MNPWPSPEAPWTGFMVALGLGLLIGLERERRKGRGADRAAAGIRSFTVAALGGALSMWLAHTLDAPLIVVAALLVAGGFELLAYRSTRSDDPGLTTELALFVTFLLGAVAMRDAVLAAGVGATMALLLASRQRLQRLATELITETELHDGLLLAALALVAVPLLRMVPVTLLGVSPAALMRLLVMLLAMQALGHVAQRILGAQRGLWWAGLSAGLVSSTATIAALGSTQREQPALGNSSAAGGLASGVATWLLAWGLIAAASPALASRLAPVLASGAVVTLLASLVWLRRRAPEDARALPERGRVFHFRQAVIVAAAMSLTVFLATQAQRRWGEEGAWIATALAAIVDAHASVAASASLAAAGNIDTSWMLRMLLVAVGINTVVRSGTAWVAGGGAFAWRIAGGLVAGWLAAVAAAWAISAG